MSWWGSVLLGSPGQEQVQLTPEPGLLGPAPVAAPPSGPLASRSREAPGDGQLLVGGRPGRLLP